MTSRCYVGAADPHRPHVVRARFVLFDGYPTAVIPALAGIWAGHARRDTHALVAAVLAHDWEYLNPTSSREGTGRMPDVGVPLAGPDGLAAVPEPVTVFPLSQAVHLDVAWIYLIDAGTHSVAVYTGDGEAAGRYHLDACVSGNPSPPHAPPVPRAVASPHCCVPVPGLRR